MFLLDGIPCIQLLSRAVKLLLTRSKSLFLPQKPHLCFSVYGTLGAKERTRTLAFQIKQRAKSNTIRLKALPKHAGDKGAGQALGRPAI